MLVGVKKGIGDLERYWVKVVDILVYLENSKMIIF